MGIDEGTDPRPLLGRALDQVERQLDALTAEDMGIATPCSDFDVRTLLAHLVAVLRKLAAVGRGLDMTAVPDPANDVSGRESAAFRSARAELESVWEDDAALDADQSVVWGTMTGRQLLDAYTHEFTVHAWDLARATDRLQKLDPALAAPALAWFTDNVSPDDRSDDGPFGPVIDVDDSADSYTRLAGFVGRSVRP